MKEIISLIERSKKYLNSAEILIKEHDYESSVSRTYYAMFYAAQALLLTKNLSFSSHKGVISGFGKHFVKTGIFAKEMGKELNRTFGKRQLGDYEYTFTISRDEAIQMLDSGTKFVQEIIKYLKL
ncbi:MAG: HEPN domain-containing protein [Chloroflexi bacterium]|nr:HEPN domain-containing protein [Chloroflexota bacterium]